MRNPDCINFRDVALLADIYAYSKAEIAAAQEHVETCLDCQKYAVEILEKWKRLGGGLKYTPKAQPILFDIYDMGVGTARYHVKVIDGQREIDCGCQDGQIAKYLKSISSYQGGTIYVMIATATADPRTAAQKDADLFDAEVKQTYAMI